MAAFQLGHLSEVRDPGVTSIVRVILQPVAVGEWCGPCLAASVAMLAMLRDVTIPWNLAVTLGPGTWLVSAPDVLGNHEAAANSDWFSGAVGVTLAAIATTEVTRGARLLDAPLGLGVADAPWVLQGASTSGRLNDLAVGLQVAALAWPRGTMRERSGEWKRMGKQACATPDARTEHGAAARPGA